MATTKITPATGSFKYDAEKDALFRLQRKQLEREQKSGVSDTLARYAANTGMGGSSEAMAAAQQTSSRYNAMIADALMAAEQKAYDRYNASLTPTGGNGMTKEEFDATLAGIDSKIDTYSVKSDMSDILMYPKILEDLYKERQNLIDKYYSYSAPENNDTSAFLTSDQVDMILSHLEENEYGQYTVDNDTYIALAYYFYSLGQDGEKLLSDANIVPASGAGTGR